MAIFTNEDISKIARFDQTQGALNDQLRLLHAVANKLGLYDAADLVQRAIVDVPRDNVVTLVRDTDDDSLEAAREMALKINAYCEQHAQPNGVTHLSPELTDEMVDVLEGKLFLSEAVMFLREVMIEQRVVPASTPKMMAASAKYSEEILSA